MTKRKSPNDLYWKSKKENQIREKYASFLKDEGKDNNPDNAQLFAIKKIAGGHDYMGMNERELILLFGDLPYMYD